MNIDLSSLESIAGILFRVWTMLLIGPSTVYLRRIRDSKAVFTANATSAMYLQETQVLCRLIIIELDIYVYIYIYI